jgi:hypothetical protein
MEHISNSRINVDAIQERQHDGFVANDRFQTCQRGMEVEFLYADQAQLRPWQALKVVRRESGSANNLAVGFRA